MPARTHTTRATGHKPQSLLSTCKRWLAGLTAVFSGRGAREGYLATFDQAVISLSNFLATIIIARAVDATELGVYGVGFIAINLARAFQEGVVVQPLNVFGAAMAPEGFKRYASTSALLQIFLTGTLSLSAALGGWVLAAAGNDTAGPAVFALWFAILGWQLQEFCRRTLYTRGRVANAVINTTLSNAVRLAILIWWSAEGKLSGVGGLTAIGWGSLAALLPGLWSTRLYWGRELLPLIDTLRRNWGFGRWVLGGSVANWIAVEFYPVLTAGMVSFAAAGAYRALQNLVAPIHLLLRAIDTFLTPRAARLYEQGGVSAVGRLLRLIYVVSGPPILGVLVVAILFRAPLLHLLYGETYLAFSQGMVLMALFYALLYTHSPLQSGFKAMRRSKPIFMANIAAALAMFTIGVAAILRWGVYGTLAGQTLNAALVNLLLWGSWLLAKRANQRTNALVDAPTNPD